VLRPPWTLHIFIDDHLNISPSNSFLTFLRVVATAAVAIWGCYFSRRRLLFLFIILVYTFRTLTLTFLCRYRLNVTWRHRQPQRSHAAAVLVSFIRALIRLQVWRLSSRCRGHILYWLVASSSWRHVVFFNRVLFYSRLAPPSVCVWAHFLAVAFAQVCHPQTHLSRDAVTSLSFERLLLHLLWRHNVLWFSVTSQRLFVTRDYSRIYCHLKQSCVTVECDVQTDGGEIMTSQPAEYHENQHFREEEFTFDFSFCVRISASRFAAASQFCSGKFINLLNKQQQRQQ